MNAGSTGASKTTAGSCFCDHVIIVFVCVWGGGGGGGGERACVYACVCVHACACVHAYVRVCLRLYAFLLPLLTGSERIDHCHTV